MSFQTLNVRVSELPITICTASSILLNFFHSSLSKNLPRSSSSWSLSLNKGESSAFLVLLRWSWSTTSLLQGFTYAFHIRQTRLSVEVVVLWSFVGVSLNLKIKCNHDFSLCGQSHLSWMKWRIFTIISVIFGQSRYRAKPDRDCGKKRWNCLVVKVK